jgi:hypothetical protein
VRSSVLLSGQGGIPLGGIGFTAQNLNQNGLGGVPLSTIPLTAPDKWGRIWRSSRPSPGRRRRM